MAKNAKGNEFKGVFGGASYKRLAALFGFTENFYNKAIGNINFDEPVFALDLGCGPGSLSYAFAQKIHSKSTLIGIDISEDQLQYARENSRQLQCTSQFINCSMDNLNFDDCSFDIVMTSMALHETPAEVRRCAIKEVSRVLKPNGLFVLIDWSKPKFGFWGIIWLPMLLNKKVKITGIIHTKNCVKRIN
jgi:ubiquinone/menaquinone biosynthesis C-methylase UbiE